MKKTLLALAACLTFAAPIMADDVWDKELNAALSVQDIKTRSANLTDLLGRADEPQDKIAAHFHLSDAQSEQGYFGAAINHLQTALDLTDESFPENVGQRDAIVSKLTGALQNAGRATDASDLVTENLSRKDNLLADIWAKTPQGLVHRQTALRCDNAVKDIVRTETFNFSAVGIDVGCDYKFLSEHNNKITLYMTQTVGDGQANHDSAIAPMIKNWSTGEITAQSQAASFSVDSGTPVLRTIIKSKSASADDYYTGAWTSVMQDWVLKTRITWNGNLGVDFGDKYAKALMQNGAKNITPQLNTCKTQAEQKRDAAPVSQGGMEALLMMVTQHADTILQPRGETECLLLKSNDEQVFLTAPVSGPRLYTLDGSAIAGEVFVTRHTLMIAGLGELDNDNPQYSLRSISYPQGNENSDEEDTINARMTLYKLYDGVPTARQAFEDFINAFNGKTSVIGSIDFLEGGNTQINIDPSSLNSETSDAP